MITAAVAAVKPQSVKSEAENSVIKIRKGSKIEKLFKMLTKGCTFAQLSKSLGMSEGGVGSYLYYYPKQYGCALKTEKKGKDTVYHLNKPEGVEIVFA